MKIWVDDIREPPDDSWLWAKTSDYALDVLDYHRHLAGRTGRNAVDCISLDHDLGGDDTSRPIVLYMCQYNFWPVDVRVHSANPVGIEWLEGMIERYKT